MPLNIADTWWKSHIHAVYSSRDLKMIRKAHILTAKSMKLFILKIKPPYGLGTLANKRCISRLNQLHKIVQHQTSAIEMPTYHLSEQYMTRQPHQYHFIISAINLCHCILTVSFQKPSRNGITYQAKSLRLLLHYLGIFLYVNL